MYSRNTARKTTDAERDIISVPPHYNGVRFNRKMRSDGRSEEFNNALADSRAHSELEKEKTPHDTAPVNETEFFENFENIENIENIENFENIKNFENTDGKQHTDGKPHEEKSTDGEKGRFLNILSGLKQDDILIIALIVVFAGERGEENRDILFLLVLLLCRR